MKTKYFISIFLNIMGLSVMGQSTVQTPWGTTVDVWTQNDMTLQQRNDMDDSLAVEYPYADFLPTLPDGNPSDPSSTSKFNCHGYAWYMYWQEDEFDDPWNMNYTEAENYFNDPSYKVCSQAEADIWWINGGSHSALSTETSGILLSKWGTGSLATHGTGNNDSPYPITSVTHYKKCSKTYNNRTFIDDEDIVVCAVKIVNSSISSYVDLDIEYEEAVLIEGPFATQIGAELYIHPE